MKIDSIEFIEHNQKNMNELLQRFFHQLTTNSSKISIKEEEELYEYFRLLIREINELKDENIKYKNMFSSISNIVSMNNYSFKEKINY